MSGPAHPDRRTVLGGMALLPAAFSAACGTTDHALSIYSTLPRAVTDRFAEGLARATGITARFWRADRAELMKRIRLEAERGIVGFDIVEMEALYLNVLKRRPGALAALPDAVTALDPERRIAASRTRAHCIAWNTRVLPPAEVPASYGDLLRPGLRHRIVIVSNAVAWFYSLHRGWGEARAQDYFDALARQGVRASSGHSLTAELLGTGEFAVTPTMYEYKMVAMKRAGDPVDFILPQPLFIERNGWALHAGSARRREATIFLGYVQGAGRQAYAAEGMVAGSLEQFHAAYPESRTGAQFAEGIDEPGVFEQWSDRLAAFLKRASTF